MELEVVQGDIATSSADLIIVNLFEGTTQPTGATGAVNEATDNFLMDYAKERDFTGKELQALAVHHPAGIKAKRIIMVGLGKPELFSPTVARKVAAKSIQKARKFGAKKVATIVHGAGNGNLNPIVAGQMLAEGLMMGNYQFTRYKTADKAKLVAKEVEHVSIVESEASKLAALRQGVTKGEAIATAVLNTRDIVNEPPSKIKPIHLAKAAQEIAGLSKTITATILDENQLKKEGYNALLAVAAGSEEKPYLIHLHYKPKQSNCSIAFVGKGVTFDSGGLGIKPWNAMLTMKGDMAGGGTVLGIFQALAELEAIGQPITSEVHGVIAATENMISGKAMRPDDIIETKSGKTIEILHTDAEGRLILSDALTFANQFKPDYMIDFATLTGAAIKALGRAYAAHMGNNRSLLELIKQASHETGELSWELPLPDFYRQYLDSSIADIQNIAMKDVAPGAIIGGLFLKEFVGDTPWAHIDIAGPAWDEDGFNPIYSKGGTGFGILLGLRILEIVSSNEA